LKLLAQVEARSEGNLLRGECGRLLRVIIAKTPPRTKSQGLAAVKRDILNVARPIRPKDIGANRATRRALASGDVDAVQTALDALTGGDFAGRRAVILTPAMHQAARDRRGRVRKDLNQAAINAGEVRQYIKTVQQRVGMAKGGWAKGARATRASVPQWASRHSRVAGVTDRLNNLLRPSITVINRSSWVNRREAERIVGNAMTSRRRSIESRILHNVRRNAQSAGIR
jgi:hypothetical protein